MSLSLFIMAKNARTVIERALISTWPHFEELSLVLNDCEDDTEMVARRFCSERKIEFLGTKVTRESHPQLYRLDVPETYKVGRPLRDESEQMLRPFTGEVMLADWSAARNEGWRLCSKEHILFLDADDVVESTTQVPRAIEIMKSEDFDVLCSRYAVKHDAAGKASYAVFRERIAKRGSTEWVRKIHEGLDLKGRKVAMAADGLYVKDMKDTRGRGTRIPNRNFKILYLHCREVGWENVGPDYLSHFIMESKEAMPRLAIEAGNLYLQKGTKADQRAWVLSMVGEAHETEKRFDDAMECYEAALKEHESSSAAYKAARVCFFRQEWERVIDFYLKGLKASMVPSVHDHNMTLGSATKILYCSALEKTGKLRQAKDVIEELVKERPDSRSLSMMRMVINDKFKASMEYMK